MWYVMWNDYIGNESMWFGSDKEMWDFVRINTWWQFAYKVEG